MPPILPGMVKSPSSQPKWWWNDQEKVNQLARYLIDKRFVTTAQELIQLQEEPHAFNRFYVQMMSDITSAINVTRPKTTEFFDDRFYPIKPGDPYESITTILSAYPAPELVRFMAVTGTVEAELRKKIKGERGSRVHDALQKNSLVKRESFDDDEWLSLVHAKLFQDMYDPKLVLNEQWCWSTEKHYAGRFDRIVMMNKFVTLLDWKTGYVGREAWLQLAAEKFAIEETLGIKIQRWGIVSLNAKVAAGWKYYGIEERSDIPKTATDEDLEKAIENAYLADIRVFDSVHVVWRDLFSGLQPKRYPIFPVPDEMDLSIEIAPMIEQQPTEITVHVEVSHEEKDQSVTESGQGTLQLDTAPSPTPSPSDYSAYQAYLDTISQLTNEQDANDLWMDVTKNTANFTVEEMNGLATAYRKKVASLKSQPQTQESTTHGKGRKKGS